MKKILAISLVVVSLLLLTSAAMADRGDRIKVDDRFGDVCCPEKEICPPIVVCFPEFTCPSIDVCLPKAPCIPDVLIEDFPEICCPEVTFDIPEICPPKAPAPCPEDDCCPDRERPDRKHR